MSSEIDFLKIDYKLAATGQGKILISEPFTKDNYFKRSVVFLTEHNEKGSIGFILNKPVEISVHEVLNNFPKIDAKISLGGPVNTNTVHYIHTLGETIPNSMKVIDNIYWGGDFEKLKLLIKLGAVKEDQIRFFIGYSGWNPKQLEREISRKYWIVTEISPEKIMSCHTENNWKEILSRLGENYKIWANFPENPEMN